MLLVGSVLLLDQQLNIGQFIAAEIVMPGTPGIGYFIWDANQNGYVSEIVLGVIWIGAIGLILDRLMAWLQTRIASGR